MTRRSSPDGPVSCPRSRDPRSPRDRLRRRPCRCHRRRQSGSASSTSPSAQSSSTGSCRREPQSKDPLQSVRPSASLSKPSVAKLVQSESASSHRAPSNSSSSSRVVEQALSVNRSQASSVIAAAFEHNRRRMQRPCRKNRQSGSASSVRPSAVVMEDASSLQLRGSRRCSPGNRRSPRSGRRRCRCRRRAGPTSCRSAR